MLFDVIFNDFVHIFVVHFTILSTHLFVLLVTGRLVE